MKTEAIMHGKLEGHSIEDKLLEVACSSEAQEVFAALGLDRFNGTSARGIAEELAISLDALFAALDLLRLAGLVREDNGRFYKISENFITKNATLEAFKSTATEIMLRQSPSAPCMYRSSIVATNRDLADKFIAQQEALISKFLEESSKAPVKDMLIGHNYSLADMIRTAKSARSSIGGEA